MAGGNGREDDKGTTLELGGKQYTLSPINLNVLIGVEEELGCSLTEIGEEYRKNEAKVLRTWVWLLLRENHPELTKEDVGRLIGLSDLARVAEVVHDGIMRVVNG